MMPPNKSKKGAVAIRESSPEPGPSSSKRAKRSKMSSDDDEETVPKSKKAAPSKFVSKSKRSPGFAAHNKPAELFRKDLISAMKLPDSEPLQEGSYFLISDPWRQEWEKGVQVPVNMKEIMETDVREICERSKTGDFKIPHKLLHERFDSLYKKGMHELTGMLQLAEQLVRYDLDDLDVCWLEEVNFTRREVGLVQINEWNMERVMEALENQCHEKMTAVMKNEEGMGIEYDEDIVCDVCCSPESEDTNEMVFCDGCDVCIHQACYGIQSIPEGSWLCRTCALGIKPNCMLCPKVGGAMKSTRSGTKWAHVSCALWIPEVSIGIPEKMEPITKISNIPPSRWALVCTLCKERVGACIQCSVKTCKTAFHVTCGFSNSLEMRTVLDETDEGDGVKLKAYCPKHTKRERERGTSESDTDSPRKDSPPTHKKEMTQQERDNLRAQKMKDLEEDFYNLVDVPEVCETLQLEEEIVDLIYVYWKLKRKCNWDKALLTPKTEEAVILEKQQEDSLLARMRMFVSLRQDLERVRNLCYMIGKREKTKRQFFRSKDYVFTGMVRVLLDKSLDLSKADVDDIVHNYHFNSIYDDYGRSVPDLPPEPEVTPAQLRMKAEKASCAWVEEKEKTRGGVWGEEKEKTRGGVWGEEKEKTRGGVWGEEKEKTTGGVWGEEKEKTRGGVWGEEKEKTRGSVWGEEKEKTRGGVWGEEKEKTTGGVWGEEEEKAKTADSQLEMEDLGENPSVKQSAAEEKPAAAEEPSVVEEEEEVEEDPNEALPPGERWSGEFVRSGFFMRRRPKKWLKVKKRKLAPVLSSPEAVPAARVQREKSAVEEDSVFTSNDESDEDKEQLMAVVKAIVGKSDDDSDAPHSALTSLLGKGLKGRPFAMLRHRKPHRGRKPWHMKESFRQVLQLSSSSEDESLKPKPSFEVEKLSPPGKESRVVAPDDGGEEGELVDVVGIEDSLPTPQQQGSVVDVEGAEAVEHIKPLQSTETAHSVPCRKDSDSVQTPSETRSGSKKKKAERDSKHTVSETCSLQKKRSERDSSQTLSETCHKKKKTEHINSETVSETCSPKKKKTEHRETRSPKKKAAKDCDSTRAVSESAQTVSESAQTVSDSAQTASVTRSPKKKKTERDSNHTVSEKCSLQKKRSERDSSQTLSETCHKKKKTVHISSQTVSETCSPKKKKTEHRETRNPKKKAAKDCDSTRAVSESAQTVSDSAQTVSDNTRAVPEACSPKKEVAKDLDNTQTVPETCPKKKAAKERSVQELFDLVKKESERTILQSSERTNSVVDKAECVTKSDDTKLKSKPVIKEFDSVKTCESIKEKLDRSITLNDMSQDGEISVKSNSSSPAKNEKKESVGRRKSSKSKSKSGSTESKNAQDVEVCAEDKKIKCEESPKKRDKSEERRKEREARHRQHESRSSRRHPKSRHSLDSDPSKPAPAPNGSDGLDSSASQSVQAVSHSQDVGSSQFASVRRLSDDSASVQKVTHKESIDSDSKSVQKVGEEETRRKKDMFERGAGNLLLPSAVREGDRRRTKKSKESSNKLKDKEQETTELFKGLSTSSGSFRRSNSTEHTNIFERMERSTSSSSGHSNSGNSSERSNIFESMERHCREGSLDLGLKGSDIQRSEPLKRHPSLDWSTKVEFHESSKSDQRFTGRPSRNCPENQESTKTGGLSSPLSPLLDKSIKVDEEKSNTVEVLQSVVESLNSQTGESLSGGEAGKASNTSGHPSDHRPCLASGDSSGEPTDVLPAASGDASCLPPESVVPLSPCTPDTDTPCLSKGDAPHVVPTEGGSQSPGHIAPCLPGESLPGVPVEKDSSLPSPDAPCAVPSENVPSLSGEEETCPSLPGEDVPLPNEGDPCLREPDNEEDAHMTDGEVNAHEDSMQVDGEPGEEVDSDVKVDTDKTDGAKTDLQVETKVVENDEEKDLHIETEALNSVESDLHIETESVKNVEGESVKNVEGESVKNVESDIQKETEPVTNVESDLSIETEAVKNVENDPHIETEAVKNVENDPHIKTEAVKNVDNYLHIEPEAVKNVENDLHIGTEAVKNVENDPHIKTEAVKNVDNYLHIEPEAVKNVENDPHIETEAVKNVENDPHIETEAVKNVENDLHIETEAVKNVENDLHIEPEAVKNVDNYLHIEPEAVKNVENDLHIGTEAVNSIESDIHIETEAVKSIETESVKNVESDLQKETEAVKNVESDLRIETEAVKSIESDLHIETEAVKNVDNYLHIETEAVKSIESDLHIEPEAVKSIESDLHIETEAVNSVERDLHSETEAVKNVESDLQKETEGRNDEEPIQQMETERADRNHAVDHSCTISAVVNTVEQIGAVVSSDLREGSKLISKFKIIKRTNKTDLGDPSDAQPSIGILKIQTSKVTGSSKRQHRKRSHKAEGKNSLNQVESLSQTNASQPEELGHKSNVLEPREKPRRRSSVRMEEKLLEEKLEDRESSGARVRHRRKSSHEARLKLSKVLASPDSSSDEDFEPIQPVMAFPRRQRHKRHSKKLERKQHGPNPSSEEPSEGEDSPEEEVMELQSTERRRPQQWEGSREAPVQKDVVAKPAPRSFTDALQPELSKLLNPADLIVQDDVVKRIENSFLRRYKYNHHHPCTNGVLEDKQKEQKVTQVGKDAKRKTRLFLTKDSKWLRSSGDSSETPLSKPASRTRVLNEITPEGSSNFQVNLFGAHYSPRGSLSGYKIPKKSSGSPSSAAAPPPPLPSSPPTASSAPSAGPFSGGADFSSFKSLAAAGPLSPAEGGWHAEGSSILRKALTMAEGASHVEAASTMVSSGAGGVQFQGRSAGMESGGYRSTSPVSDDVGALMAPHGHSRESTPRRCTRSQLADDPVENCPSPSPLAAVTASLKMKLRDSRLKAANFPCS